MKKTFCFAIALSAWCLVPGAVKGFPPAPHHLFYGTVRDEHRYPLEIPGAVVILESPGGQRLTGSVLRLDGQGINYRLAVPLDAGLTADAYQPTALRPYAPFAIQVVIEGRTYVPLELGGGFGAIGEAGGMTRLDLTLGEDTDKDGLPDAWERGLIQRMEHLRSLADVRPDGDADGDGLTNRQEYMAGSFAHDPGHLFELKITRFEAGFPILEWLAVQGRTYEVHGSADLTVWQPVSVRRVGDAAGGVIHSLNHAAGVQRIAVVPAGADADSLRYFRVTVR